MNMHYRTSIDAVTLSVGRIRRYLPLCWDFSDLMTIEEALHGIRDFSNWRPKSGMH
jgi:hypothetical protein